jgi:DNA invertase Pin-like site-specific DNA recombinase
MDAVIYLRVSTKEQAAKDETGEGYSIPTQREACLRYIAERGWNLAGEFTDAGESARTADRPMLKELLRRVAEGGIGVVVVHKIDRLARSMEDHVAIRAALRHAGVQLVAVTENIEETASGRLVEGIHALMAEFYSANLAGEIRKGMTQKAKMGGWPTKAPIGYLNVREKIAGKEIAKVTLDPESERSWSGRPSGCTPQASTRSPSSRPRCTRRASPRRTRGDRALRSRCPSSPSSLPTPSISALSNGQAFDTQASTRRSSPRAVRPG